MRPMPHCACPREASVITFRRFASVLIVAAVIAGLAAWEGPGSRVYAQGEKADALAGAWTLNKDLSDAPQDRPADGRESGDRRSRGSGGGGGGGRGRGGFGGGFG